jgi:ceramide glucosyltransferase
MSSAGILVAGLCDLLAAAATAYFAMAIWAAKRYQKELRQSIDPTFTPPVSILKSLKGLDPKMYAAFRSHCMLDYPEYEVLFGAHDPGELALTLVEKLRQEFPERNLRVIHCPQVLGLNGKVSNLAQMLPQARYEYIIINDSDIVVPRNYLRRALAPFADSHVGMVTTLYRGIPGRSIGSRMEALGLSSDFTGGVLIARALEGGIRFALGATIATTNSVLREIGGLEPLVDYLGDDYELGARTAAKGYKIELADTIVDTALPDYSFRDFWAHQMRWARNIKDRRPAQYLGLIVTFGLPWAILTVLLQSRALWAWLLLVLAAATRLAAAQAAGRDVLHDENLEKDAWILPFRDIAALAVWIASFFGPTVEWRGLRFRLRKGKLEKTGRA